MNSPLRQLAPARLTARRAPTCRRAIVAPLLAISALLSACGGGSDAAGDTTGVSATSIASPVASDPVPTTDVPVPTTASAPPTTAPAPTTTVAPSTTVPFVPPTTIPLPQPIIAPADAEAPEPVVELGRLAIPALDLDRPMYEGIRLPTFDLGPGHWPGSAAPGQVGNMVIGGHRTEGNADFRNIDQLQPGDEMIVTTTDGVSHTYVVEWSEIIDPFAARVINQTPEKTATLFACDPPGSVRQRIVVHLALAA